jgi:hypothetical protein
MDTADKALRREGLLRSGATLVIAHRDGAPLTDADRDRVIHALIDQFGGVQDHALGTVVIPIPLEGLDEIKVQGWLHAWE